MTKEELQALRTELDQQVRRLRDRGSNDTHRLEDMLRHVDSELAKHGVAAPGASQSASARGATGTEPRSGSLPEYPEEPEKQQLVERVRDAREHATQTPPGRDAGGTLRGDVTSAQEASNKAQIARTVAEGRLAFEVGATEHPFGLDPLQQKRWRMEELDGHLVKILRKTRTDAEFQARVDAVERILRGAALETHHTPGSFSRGGAGVMSLLRARAELRELWEQAGPEREALITERNVFTERAAELLQELINDGLRARSDDTKVELTQPTAPALQRQAAERLFDELLDRLGYPPDAGTKDVKQRLFDGVGSQDNKIGMRGLEQLWPKILVGILLAAGLIAGTTLLVGGGSDDVGFEYAATPGAPELVAACMFIEGETWHGGDSYVLAGWRDGVRGFELLFDGAADAGYTHVSVWYTYEERWQDYSNFYEPGAPMGTGVRSFSAHEHLLGTEYDSASGHRQLQAEPDRVRVAVTHHDAGLPLQALPQASIEPPAYKRARLVAVGLYGGHDGPEPAWYGRAVEEIPPFHGSVPEDWAFEAPGDLIPETIEVRIDKPADAAGQCPA